MILIFFNRAFRFLLAAIIFLVPVHMAYIFSFDPESSQYTRIAYTLLDLFLFIALIASVPLSAKKQIQCVLPRYILMPLFFAMLFAGVSIFFAVHADVALLFLLHTVQGAALFLIFSSGMLSKKTIARVFVLAGAVQALWGIQQIITQEIFAYSWLGIAAHSAATLGDSVVEGSGFRILRAYGSFPHPNMLAAFLGMSFFCGLYLYRAAMTRAGRLACLFASMCILWGFLLTFSRGAWLALFLSVCVSGFFGIFRKNESGTFSVPLRFFIASAILVSIFTILYWQPVSVRLGLQGSVRLEERSIDERSSYIRDASAIIRAHPLGIGIGQYTPFRMDRDTERDIYLPAYSYQPVHSYFILILAELGVFGLLFFLLFFSSVVLHIIKFGNYIAIAGVLFLFFVSFFDHYFWTVQSGVLLWWIWLGFLLGEQRTLLLTKSNELC
ncbi:O-antigen ligase family protein [Candidatus Uhrbacteria bacterium]|nr:O-antigen ligase family protein [Candidatus Uhrbacteria bacterium]